MNIDDAVGFGWASFIRGALFGIAISSIIWVKIAVA